jgi:hypothetical protein
MLDINYKGYTIKVRSQLLSHGKWEPLAMVWWQEEDMPLAEPIASGELQGTEDLADAVGLKLAISLAKHDGSSDRPIHVLNCRAGPRKCFLLRGFGYIIGINSLTANLHCSF